MKTPAHIELTRNEQGLSWTAQVTYTNHAREIMTQDVEDQGAELTVQALIAWAFRELP